MNKPTMRETISDALANGVGLIEVTAILAEQIDFLTARVEALSPKPKKAKPTSIASPVWAAYAEAFDARYNLQPTRNARTNRSILTIVESIGVVQAVELMRFYIKSNDAFYVKQRHPISLLVRDVHRLTTDMHLGRSVSSSEASKIETTNTGRATAEDFLRNKYGPF